MDWLNETIFIITTGTNSDKLWKSELHGQTMSPMSRNIFLNFEKSCDGRCYTITIRYMFNLNLVRGIIFINSSL